MSVSVDFVVTFVNITINIIVLIKIIQEYKESRYKNLRYFLYSIILFIFCNSAIIPSTIGFTTSFNVSLIIQNLVICSILCAVFLIIIFFDSFWSDSPFSTRNRFLSISLSINLTGQIGITSVICIFSNVLFPGYADITQVDWNLVSREGILLIILYLIILLYTYINLLIFLGILVVSLGRRIKQGKTRSINEIIIKMRRGAIMLLVGASILLFFPNIALLCIFIGYFMIFILYMKGGLLILREDILQRIMIISESGVPLYTFNFTTLEKVNEEEQTNLKSNETIEIMFSGAIKAISSLLAELTGLKQELREIVLDNTILIVKNLLFKKCYIVLVLDRRSAFYSVILEQFASKVESILDTLEEGDVFNQDQIIETNELIKTMFKIK